MDKALPTVTTNHDDHLTNARNMDGNFSSEGWRNFIVKTRCEEQLDRNNFGSHVRKGCN